MNPPAPPVDTSTCPYCGAATEPADAAARVYQCRGDWGRVLVCTRFPDCDAYVGIHKGTDTPKGTLANRNLRAWRKLAHEVFDPLWRSGRMGRHGAYLHLAKLLGIAPEVCHIAWFDQAGCERVVELLTADRVRA